jgi:hypothetical protein
MLILWSTCLTEDGLVRVSSFIVLTWVGNDIALTMTSFLLSPPAKLVPRCFKVYYNMYFRMMEYHLQELGVFRLIDVVYHIL